jgi:mannose-1-phosphate guanylyltransferase
MRAVVLVGGFGTRLRPLTDHVPKPMLPIGHQPMIVSLVERLARGGVTDVTLALGFRPEPFLAAFPDGRCGDVVVRYAVEPTPLDTAGAIRFAADHSGIDSTFVVANGDVVTDLAVDRLIGAHRERGAEATIHLTPVADPSAFGVVEVAADGRVERFVEKPPAGSTPSNLINAGTYVLERSVLDLVAPGRPTSIERETFPALVERGTLHAFATDDYWIDTGRPELYRAANVDLVSGRRAGQRVEAVGRDAHVDATAVLERSLVGAGATVGPGARVVDSVVLPGASVGAGAAIDRSVVMGRVGRNAVVVDAVVGADGDVADGAELVAARLPAPPPS